LIARKASLAMDLAQGFWFDRPQGKPCDGSCSGLFRLIARKASLAMDLAQGWVGRNS
jgi:hypothetical protein